MLSSRSSLAQTSPITLVLVSLPAAAGASVALAGALASGSGPVLGAAEPTWILDAGFLARTRGASASSSTGCFLAAAAGAVEAGAFAIVEEEESEATTPAAAEGDGTGVECPFVADSEFVVETAGTSNAAGFVAVGTGAGEAGLVAAIAALGEPDPPAGFVPAAAKRGRRVRGQRKGERGLDVMVFKNNTASPRIDKGKEGG
jgi:hypothetical protein